ncbi:MAG: hypothetical protein ACTHON_18515 [Humibacter sp.]
MSDTHGTEAGYQRHRRAGEQPCGHCVWAHRDYNRITAKQREERALRRLEAKPRPVLIPGLSAQHGTPQAIQQHALEQSPICDPCLTSACDWERYETYRYLRRLRGAS